MASRDDQARITAALNAALDAFDDDDENDDSDADEILSRSAGVVAKENNATIESTPKRPMMGPPRPPPSVMGPLPPAPDFNDMDPEKLLADMMKHLVGDSLPQGDGSAVADSPDTQLLGKLMQDLNKELTNELTRDPSVGQKKGGGDKSKKSVPKPQSLGKQNSNSEFDETISNLVEGIASQASIDGSEEAANNMDQNEGEFLSSLIDEFKKLGESDFTSDAVVDGMMEQLLSKDLMYEPMKQVAAKFPDWLAEKRNEIPEQEFIERSKQHQCFRQLVHVYETEPDNTAKLVLLMQEVHEYGQPPAEIIHEIAPGLELDEEGMPKLGAAGFPMGDNEECRIM